MRSSIWTSRPPSKRKRRGRPSACRRETSASSTPRSSPSERPSSTDVLDLPFFDRGHAELAARLDANAGSDPAGIETTARRDGDWYRLSGAKTFISNAGLASFYVVFARTDAAAGANGLSAFVVDADAPGLRVARQIDVLAPHPLGELQFG